MVRRTVLIFATVVKTTLFHHLIRLDLLISIYGTNVKWNHHSSVGTRFAMLSLVSHRFLRLAFKISYFSNSSPYLWDKKRNLVEVTSSKLKAIAFWVNFVLMIGYEAFLLVGVYRALMSPPSANRVQEVVKITYNAVLYMFPVALQYNIIRRWEEIPACVNSYLVVFQRFEDRFYLHTEKQHKNGCEGVLKAFRFITLPIMMQNTIQILRAPSTPIFLTSLLQPYYLQRLLYRLPLMIIHAQIWMTICSTLVFTAAVLYLYVYPAVFILDEMVARTSRHARINSHDNLRTPGVFMSLYRTMQVLHAQFHYCFQYKMLPSKKAIVTAVAVLGIYGAIKIDGPRAVSMGLTATGVLLHLTKYFESLAQLHTVSKKLLASWKGREMHCMRMFLRSCRPLSVYVSSVYYVSETTVLVLFNVIANATITLLLT